jgi:hypothetical protein
LMRSCHGEREFAQTSRKRSDSMMPSRM